MDRISSVRISDGQAALAYGGTAGLLVLLVSRAKWVKGAAAVATLTSVLTLRFPPRAGVSYAVHMGSLFSPASWSSVEEACQLIGGKQIEIKSRINRVENATLALRGYSFSPDDFPESPSTTGTSLPKLYAEVAYRKVKQLKVLKKPKEGVREVVIIFSGNAGAVEGGVTKAGGYLKRGRHVQLVNIRGYNRSEGTPTAEGAHLDIEAMVDYAVNKHGKGVRLIFHGQSLGAHFALWGANYAAKTYGPESVAGCLMDRPFATLGTAATTLTSVALLGRIAQAVCSYDNVSLLREFATKKPTSTLIVRGRFDRLMNPKAITNKRNNPQADGNVEPLFQAWKGTRNSKRKELIYDAYVTHNSSWWWTDEKAVNRWVQILNASQTR